MFTMHMIRRTLPSLGRTLPSLGRTLPSLGRTVPSLGKRACSNLKVNETSYRIAEEYMMKMMPKFVGGCGIVGGGYGMYDAYVSNRHRSYSECSALTTAYFFMGVVLGAWGGIVTWFISPVLVPTICVGIPIAGCTMMVKYFDKNATSDTKKEDYTIWKDK